jgi:hypothetical protein
LEGSALRAIVAREDEVDPDQRFADLQVRRTDVMAQWPAADAKGGSISTEQACQRWLAKLMKDSAESPVSKGKLRSMAMEKFRGLSAKGFYRAWNSAIEATGAKAWAKAGRRPRIYNHAR